MRTRRTSLKAVVAALAALGGGGAALGTLTVGHDGTAAVAGTAMATLLSSPRPEPVLLTAAEFGRNPLYRGCREPLRAWLATHGLDANDCVQAVFADGFVTATVMEHDAAGKPFSSPDRAGPITTLVRRPMQSLPPLPQFGYGIALPPIPADLGEDWRAVVETLPAAEGRLRGEWDR